MCSFADQQAYKGQFTVARYRELLHFERECGKSGRARMGHICAKPKMTDKTAFTELAAKDIDGKMRNFSEFASKVVMVVNVASA